MHDTSGRMDAAASCASAADEAKRWAMAAVTGARARAA
jgi:hypothetical protein